MQKISRLIMPAIAIAIGVTSFNAGAQMRDPARWHQEDMSSAARYRTLTKEANAAYQQRLGECRHDRRASERNACAAEAKRDYNHDMMEAKGALRR